MLHLLNGDATAAVFPQALPGERAVWRDILMEGPAVADAATRAAWLSARLGVSIDTYLRGWREGEAVLARAREHDEVVLWFERDLFCTINLWFVLGQLDAPRASLIYPEVDDDIPGLGHLAAAQLEMLFELRSPVSTNDVADARRLWRAYAGSDPSGFSRLTPTLSYARAAIRMHCVRFPSVANGLDEIEERTLAGLHDALNFDALFRVVTAECREFGMGDVQFAAILRDLAHGTTPLITIEQLERPFRQWRISRTSRSADVLAGRADRLALVPLDRWLGGVHLRPGAPLWRWDAERLTLVPD